MSEIDTEIRRFTESGTNLFAELGFGSAEAARCQAELQKRIGEARALHEQPTDKLALKRS